MVTFNFALCNEVLRPMPFEEQCRHAARLGYVGLEVAPFTLHEAPDRISLTQARAWGQMAREHGVPVTGLHWLLVALKSRYSTASGFVMSCAYPTA